MKYAICYKGVFNYKFLETNVIDNEYLESFKNAFLNHKKYIYDNILENTSNELDIFVSTYSTDERLEKIITEKYKPKSKVFKELTPSLKNNTWVSQLMHYKSIIDMIKKFELENNFLYDFIITTRFDINIHKEFTSMNIVKDSFNIVVEHPSGNCDDNFWVFDRNLLNFFESAINELIHENKTTHEINHKIKKMGCNVNYIEPLIDSYMGHTLFTFIR